jgi:hypothetical protein
MAGPGEVIHCKLSVMTQALFRVSPLPPYHHVFNVDKSSHRIEDTPIKAPQSSKSKVQIAPPPQGNPPTQTYPDDFYPIAVGLMKHTDIPLPRPQMLGVLLEPRVDSPINLKNKDEWDYVLRKCFVTEAQGIQAALKNLAFGGEGLIDKIESEEEGRFKGRRVRRDKIVRDLTVEDWTRVVDVFGKWAFKPEVSWFLVSPSSLPILMLGYGMERDSHMHATRNKLINRISSSTLVQGKMQSVKSGKIKSHDLYLVKYHLHRSSPAAQQGA